jgi:uncharacterized Zn finger protein
MAGLTDRLARLGWEDLSSWASPSSVRKGRSYKGRVTGIAQTTDGGLLAWVQGSERYATRVGLDQQGKLVSHCSCPIGHWTCKHAVAVVLVGIEQVGTRAGIKAAASDDIRLSLTSPTRAESEASRLGEVDGASGLHPWSAETGQASGTAAGQSSRLGHKPDEDWQAFLERMPQAEMAGFLKELAERQPSVLRSIRERMDFKDGQIQKIVTSLRKEIQKLASRDPWADSWSDRGWIPDYSHVREQLESLLANGHADSAIQVGEELWRRGQDQVERAQDEGETGQEITACMEVVLRAVCRSSMTRQDQLLWVINRQLEDEFGLLDGLDKTLEPEGGFSSADWSSVADALAARLAAGQASCSDPAGPSRYDREHTMGWLIQALENSGREGEVLPILEREAPITKCYGILVGRLFESRRWDAARRWAIRGHADTAGDLPGLAADLRVRLREIATKEGNLALAAAYRSAEFFVQAGLASYKELRGAAERAKVWPEVREWALAFLRHGCLPATFGTPNVAPSSLPVPAARRQGRSGRAAPPNQTGERPDAPPGLPPWPLPPCEIVLPPGVTSVRKEPDIHCLIEIAIEEGRNDDALALRAEKSSGRFHSPWASGIDCQLARAVTKTHPDAALAIFKRLAEAQIALVKPAAYETAGGWLREARDICRTTGREAEWKTYLLRLRQEHRAKRRLMEVLDGLEGRPIAGAK